MVVLPCPAALAPQTSGGHTDGRAQHVRPGYAFASAAACPSTAIIENARPRRLICRCTRLITKARQRLPAAKFPLFWPSPIRFHKNCTFPLYINSGFFVIFLSYALGSITAYAHRRLGRGHARLEHASSFVIWLFFPIRFDRSYIFHQKKYICDRFVAIWFVVSTLQVWSIVN